MINNYDILKHYVPEEFDGDTFYYTEILDRSKKAGNNKGRRLRTFYHRTRQEFSDQMEQIIESVDGLAAMAAQVLQESLGSLTDLGREPSDGA